VAALGASGCFHALEAQCGGCVVARAASDPPPVGPGKTGLVVVVHGAYGLGREWLPIRGALLGRPDLAHFVFVWRGPRGAGMRDPGEALRTLLQASLDRLPIETRDVLVLAHSAGGPVAEYAARRLVVPEGVRVEIALLDPARTTLATYQPVEPIETPLDGAGPFAARVAPPPLPAAVAIREYRAGTLLGKLLAALDRVRPVQSDVRDPRKERVTLGDKVGHGAAVAVAGLPLIERLGRTASATGASTADGVPLRGTFLVAPARLAPSP
jgi:hypothetical protein